MVTQYSTWPYGDFNYFVIVQPLYIHSATVRECKACYDIGRMHQQVAVYCMFTTDPFLIK